MLLLNQKPKEGRCAKMAQYDKLTKVTKNNNKGGFTMDNQVVASYGIGVPIDTYNVSEMLLNRLVHDCNITFEYIGKVCDEILVIVNFFDDSTINVNEVIDYLKENL